MAQNFRTDTLILTKQMVRASGDSLYVNGVQIGSLISGNLQVTGSTLYTLVTGASGQAVIDYATKVALQNTGQQAWLAAQNNALNLSGNLQTTGSNLYATLTGLSGQAVVDYATKTALQNTGQAAWLAADNNARNISGNMSATGAALIQRDLDISGALQALITNSDADVNSINGQSGVITISGTGGLTVLSGGAGLILVSGDQSISGALTATGVALGNTIANTGQAAWTAAQNNALNLSGNLQTTGSNLYAALTGLSGQAVTDYATKVALQNTGQQAWLAADNNGINLSGNLQTTGSNLYTTLTGLSGQAVIDYATKVALQNTGQQAWLAAQNNALNLSGNMASTGATLGAKIDSLSGYSAPALANYVYTTGDQSVGGIKTLTSELRFVAGEKTPVKFIGDTNYNFVSGDFIAIATGAVPNVTGILPSPTDYSGVWFHIKNSRASSYQISGVIDGEVNPTIYPRDSITIFGYSGAWTYLRQTGSPIWADSNNNALNLSGSLQTTGSNLYTTLTGLSGQVVIDYATKTQLTASGVDLGIIIANTGQAAWLAAQNNALNLSGNLTTTGTLLSAVKVTGSAIINNANFTGLGGTLIFSSGEFIFVSGGAGGGGGSNVQITGSSTLANANFTGLGGTLVFSSGGFVFVSGGAGGGGDTVALSGWATGVSGSLQDQINLRTGYQFFVTGIPSGVDSFYVNFPTGMSTVPVVVPCVHVANNTLYSWNISQVSRTGFLALFSNIVTGSGEVSLHTHVIESGGTVFGIGVQGAAAALDLYATGSNLYNMLTGASGNFVIGPASSTDSFVPLYDGIDGKKIKNSTINGDWFDQNVSSTGDPTFKRLRVYNIPAVTATDTYVDIRSNDDPESTASIYVFNPIGGQPSEIALHAVPTGYTSSDKEYQEGFNSIYSNSASGLLFAQQGSGYYFGNSRLTTPQDRPWLGVRETGLTANSAVASSGNPFLFSIQDILSGGPSSSTININFASGVFLYGAGNMPTGSTIIERSVDGLNWTVQKTGLGSSPWNFAFGTGRWVAAIGGGTGKIATSIDNGITWDQYSGPGSITSPTALAFGSTGIWVMGAGDSQTLTNKVAYSYNGINWIASTTPTGAFWTNAAYGNSLFVMAGNRVGLGGATTSGFLVSSSDGINWTTRFFQQTGHAPTEGGLIFSNNQFLCCRNINTGFSIISRSNDGITWNNDIYYSGEIRAPVFARNYYYFWDSTLSNYVATQNFISWKTGDYIGSTPTNQRNAVYGNGRIVAGGTKLGVSELLEGGKKIEFPLYVSNDISGMTFHNTQDAPFSFRVGAPLMPLYEKSPIVVIDETGIDSLGNVRISGHLNLSGQLLTTSGNNLYISGVLLANYPNLTGMSGQAVTDYATKTSLQNTGQQAWLAAQNNALNLSGNLQTTGSNLYVTLTGLSGQAVIDYATKTALQNTGQAAWLAADNNGINISGNMAATGATLIALNLSTSGVLDTKLTASGVIIEAQINSLSGWSAPALANYVYTTGNQSVAGIKTITSEFRMEGGTRSSVKHFGDANYTLTSGDYVVMATGAVPNVTGILPSPTDYSGIFFILVNNRTASLPVSGVIGPDTNPLISPYDAIEVYGTSGIWSYIGKTGSNIWADSNNNALNISGNMTATGASLRVVIDNTGQAAWTAAQNNALNLSGNLTTTGTLLSAVKITGSNIINVANFTGLGGTLIFSSGEFIFVSGAAGGGGGSNVKVTGSENIATADFTGLGGTLVFWSGNQIFISGGAAGAPADHGDGINLSGNLQTTGSNLYTLLTNMSGNAVVNSLNGLINHVNVKGTGGLTTLQIGQNIYVSGDTTVSVSGNVLFAGSDGRITGDAHFTYDPAVDSVKIGQNVTVLPNNPLAMMGSGNTYIQVNLQNKASGTSAQADYILTADNGTDTNNFVDLGINNQKFADTGYELYKPLDGFLYNRGGDMHFGTAVLGNVVKFHVGGIQSGHLVATIDAGGLVMSGGKNVSVAGTGEFYSGTTKLSSLFSAVKVTGSSIISTPNFTGVNGLTVVQSGNTIAIGGILPNLFTRGGTLYNPDGIPSGQHLIPIWMAPYNCTATGVRGFIRSGTSATINAVRDTVAVGGDSDLLISDLNINATGAWIGSGIIQNFAFVTGDSLMLRVTQNVNNPVAIAIQVDFVRP